MQNDESVNSTTKSERSATRQRFDWSTVRPTTAVIETVAQATDEDPIDLDRLSSAVDPDALDKLVTLTGPSAQGDVQTTFTYEGHVVTVRSSGLIAVAPSSGSA